MAGYRVEITHPALIHLKFIRAADRRPIERAIDTQLVHEPLVEHKNRKPMRRDFHPSFYCTPPVWELRVRDYRVYYDVDLAARLVYIRAVRKKPPHKLTEEII
jgi:hypothetical protein